jgi:hypothetical protein
MLTLADQLSGPLPGLAVGPAQFWAWHLCSGVGRQLLGDNSMPL